MASASQVIVARPGVAGGSDGKNWERNGVGGRVLEGRIVIWCGVVIRICTVTSFPASAPPVPLSGSVPPLKVLPLLIAPCPADVSFFTSQEHTMFQVRAELAPNSFCIPLVRFDFWKCHNGSLLQRKLQQPCQRIVSRNKLPDSLTQG